MDSYRVNFPHRLDSRGTQIPKFVMSQLDYPSSVFNSDPPFLSDFGYSTGITAPSSLKRVSKKWVLIPNDEIERDLFIAWWIQSTCGILYHERGLKEIDWGKKQTSKCWATFYAVANENTGQLCVLCHFCPTTYPHPNIRLNGKQSQGTKAIKRHKCQGSKGQRLGYYNQPSIIEALQSSDVRESARIV